MTEIGASNFFFVWKNQDNELELVTAPIDGLVLPGILRDSVLTLARKIEGLRVAEKYVTITEFIDAIKEQRVLEAFGCGTAVTLAPMGTLHYHGYGRVEHDWAKILDI